VDGNGEGLPYRWGGTVRQGQEFGPFLQTRQFLLCSVVVTAGQWRRLTLLGTLKGGFRFKELAN